MEVELNLPQNASQWFKLRKNPRLFLWWMFHRLTTPLRVLPDFLVIGTMKGGTTSLFNYLAQHPQLQPPFRKEIKFFDIHYTQGMGWYRAHFPMRFKMQAGTLTGEATPYYIFHPAAPERIAQTLPHVRLITLLRNPIDRAYSHYNHMLRVGRETLPFEEAINREPERLAGEAEKIIADPRYSTFKHLHYSYLSRGRYIEQLNQWFELFPREQMLILSSEELYTSPALVYRKTVGFLGTAAWEPDNFSVFKKGGYEEMSPRLRKRLADYYRPYNEKLYAYLGTTFNWDK